MQEAKNRSIEDRLSRIENSLDKITGALDQAPALISIAADTVDSGYQASKEAGVDVDQRLKSGIELFSRLSEPHMLESLNKLLDFVEQAPGLASMAADSIDERFERQAAKGMPVQDKIERIAKLLNRATDPKLLDKAEAAIDFVNQLPGWSAMAVDAFDDFVVENKFIHMDMANMLKDAGTALSDAREQPPAKVGGIFGLYRALQDEDRKRALGFLMNFLKNFGQTIK